MHIIAKSRVDTWQKNQPHIRQDIVKVIVY